MLFALFVVSLFVKFQIKFSVVLLMLAGALSFVAFVVLVVFKGGT